MDYRVGRGGDWEQEGEAGDEGGGDARRGRAMELGSETKTTADPWETQATLLRAHQLAR